MSMDMDDFIEKYITTEPRKWLFCVVVMLMLVLIVFFLFGIPMIAIFYGHGTLGGILLVISICIGLGTWMYCNGVMD